MNKFGVRTLIALTLLAGQTATAAPQVIFEVTSFASPPNSLTYFSGFSGTVGTTPVWPAEMGWQGDRVDIAFALPAGVPANARHYRFRVVMPVQFQQNFNMTVQAGSSLGGLQPIETQFIDTARVLTATIPLDRFAPGQTNYLRLQGAGVLVGSGQPAGVRWTRWALTRTDTPMSLDAFQLDQIQRLATYTRNAIMPSGLVRDALPFSPGAAPFHPATPDAAGFALLALAAADRMGVMADGELLTERVLSAYSGSTSGVTPLRNVRGHWWHWLNVNNGAAAAGWPQEYTTIGSALLGAGALFAKNHFSDNPLIASYADDIYSTCDWDAMIHPSLDGRVFAATNAAGGEVGSLRPWNEYMIIVSLALRQAGATRAPGMSGRWLDPAQCPRRSYADLSTLTDNPGGYAPAFWVHQQYYFNPDFAGNATFVQLLNNHKVADELYCATTLGQRYRYGLTAGVSPSGYTADRIFAHENVFSPEAVGGWKDLFTLLEFAQDQNPTSDARFRYGLTRVSSVQPSWIPPDAALVDHLFLMYGLVECAEPSFFRARQPFQADGDGDGLADAFDNCPGRFNRLQDDGDTNGVGDACQCGPIWADRDGDSDVDLQDFAAIQACPRGGVALAEACYCFDRDEDQALGGGDLDAFGDCLNASGADVAADPACGP